MSAHIEKLGQSVPSPHHNITYGQISAKFHPTLVFQVGQERDLFTVFTALVSI